MRWTWPWHRAQGWFYCRIVCPRKVSLTGRETSADPWRRKRGSLGDRAKGGCGTRRRASVVRPAGTPSSFPGAVNRLNLRAGKSEFYSLGLSSFVIHITGKQNTTNHLDIYSRIGLPWWGKGVSPGSPRGDSQSGRKMESACPFNGPSLPGQTRVSGSE